jgi:hypothetical protein
VLGKTRVGGARSSANLITLVLVPAVHWSAVDVVRTVQVRYLCFLVIYSTVCPNQRAMYRARPPPCDPTATRTNPPPPAILDPNLSAHDPCCRHAWQSPLVREACQLLPGMSPPLPGAAGMPDRTAACAAPAVTARNLCRRSRRPRQRLQHHTR